jgi:hypothetical protein
MPGYKIVGTIGFDTTDREYTVWCSQHTEEHSKCNISATLLILE